LRRAGGEVITMKISLPESLKAFVDAQVEQWGYVSSSDYVCELIHKEHERDQLRKLLLDGANSGPGVKADADFFKRLRKPSG
jgi:antitoxin ParD1/3/4